MPLRSPELFRLLALMGALFLPALPMPAAAQETKAELTPAFWQKDPAADFADEGRTHCAPTAAADGLIYLAQAYGLEDLVPGTDHEAQIELIAQLAEDFGTDPAIGGTNPDKILTGLRRYLEGRDYELARLEVQTWRGVSAANKGCKTSTRPDLSRLARAAETDGTVVLCNFGWYYPSDDSYVRKGGHWVVVVGADSEMELQVHNPLLAPEAQAEQTAVQLSPLEDEFSAAGHAEMSGYYEAEGPGLPHGAKVRAVLDAVIIFRLQQ